MPEFPGNSRQEKRNEITEADDPNEVRVEQVVFDGVVRRKKPVGRKLLDLIGSVVKELAQDVLIPAVKDTARDFLNEGLNRAFDRDGERRPSGRRSYSGGSRVGTTIHTPYNQMAQKDTSRRRYETFEPINLEEVILKTHVQAEGVAEEMGAVLRRYKIVTVADLNHILGQSDITNPQDHNWGWTDLSELRIRRIREGYLMQFPEVEDLK
jgi:hypothetical protein